MSAARPYIRMARVDHWSKNALMLLGVLLAAFYQPDLVTWATLPALVGAFAATCLIASANYVINEWLDAATDRFHPTKRTRPAVSGAVRAPLVYAFWGGLGIAGLSLAFAINPYTGLSGAGLWAMGVLYNVPPLRLKEWPYFDVLSESLNNPIRLLLGWFAVVPFWVPPLSLLIAYWMAGAFLMAAKRLAEYREIGDPAAAGDYRRSFRYYTEERLLVSLLFYAIMGGVFGGIFVLRYHLELLLASPVLAGLFAYYLKLTLQPDSVAQHPEHLWRKPGLVIYVAVAVALFVTLMFVRIPILYRWFNVQSSELDVLWTIGGP